MEFEDDTWNVQLFLGFFIEVGKRGLVFKPLLLLFLDFEILAKKALDLCGKYFLFMNFKFFSRRSTLPNLAIINKVLLYYWLPVVLLNDLIDLLLLLTEESLLLLETILPHTDLKHQLLAKGSQCHWSWWLL